MKCPKCGNRKIVKKEGITHCPSCGIIGTPPVLGNEEYPKIIRTIHFA